MFSNFLNLAFFISSVLISVKFVEVSADCENYWLDQYEDVLPTINNRPEFPDSITDAFEVNMDCLEEGIFYKY